MRHGVPLLAALVSSATLVLAPPAGAKRVACGSSFDLPRAKCSTITVPLDRSGKVAGKVELFSEFVPAKKKPKATIAIFPGGPGAATSILGYDVLPIVRNQMDDHDLLLFDQRGTGRSGYLDCDDELLGGSISLLVGDNSRAIGKGVQRCAKKLGPKRSFYTTRETVADLEDVRRSLGIDKLVLLGVSYGTRDAMAYARAYPQHVDRIVLDSLVDDRGLDAFGLHTVQAVPRLLRQLCRGGGCDSITSDPVADLNRLVARLRRGPIRPRQAVKFAGCSTRVAITRSRLFGLFQAADQDPKLLSQLPIAINRAVNGKPYQLSLLLSIKSPKLTFCALARLFEELFPVRGVDQDERLFETAFSTGQQVATLCEETELPWPRTAGPAQRGRYAEEALDHLPDSSFLPFDRSTALYASLVSTCKFWPAAPEPPLVARGPLPEVPVLILAGLDDLRTPAEDALALATVTPSAQLLPVPDVGHSTLTTSACARRGFWRFMAGQQVSQCHRYPKHRPAPAKRVEPWQHELERLLQRVPRPN